MKKTCVLLVSFLILFFVGCSSEKSDVEQETETSIVIKQIDVFGVHVYATATVADKKMLHAANMLAEYLDNDEDGIPDNQRVVDVLVKHKTSLIIAKDEDEMFSLDRSTLPRGKHRAFGMKKQSLEVRNEAYSMPHWKR